MEVILLITTVLATTAAIASFALLQQSRKRERERTDARVAALGRASGAVEPEMSGGITDPRLFGSVQREAPARNRLPILAAAALIAVLGGALVFLDTPAADLTAGGAATAEPRPIELVSLGHGRENGALAISGIVRNPENGSRVEGLTAVISLLDRDGALVSIKDVPLDYRALRPGEEAPFRVAIPHPGDIARYRVSFRSGAAVVPHIDRRTNATLASAVR
jgi:hypothetical protein